MEGDEVIGGAPPHSLEAERECLASVFIAEETFDEVAAVIGIGSDDFYVDRHARIWRAMARLWDAKVSIDAVTVRQALIDAGDWERCGGARVLSEILDRSGTWQHVAHYARIVRDKAQLRRLGEVAASIAVGSRGDVDDVDAFVEDAERRVIELRERGAGGGGLEQVGGAVLEALDAFERAVGSDGGITGLRTGLRAVDHVTHGLQDGDLIIIAGRPAMGKTALALDIAQAVAMGIVDADGVEVQAPQPVAVFSLEMPRAQLAARGIAAAARVSLGALRSGRVAVDDWARVAEAADRIHRAPLYIDDAAGLTPAALRAKCRRMQRRHGLRLVVVDYLQLMHPNGRHGTREQEISSISRAMKELAKDLGCPVIALSQLNRGLESRTDKRPMMSDLRESGAIEQDADLIGFVYREEVYTKEATPAELLGAAELIIGKFRQGSPQTIRLRFHAAQTRFADV